MIAARKIINKHIAVIILISVIGAYLITKALPENSWDGWRVGSAQTLLSDKHWTSDFITLIIHRAIFYFPHYFGH